MSTIGEYRTVVGDTFETVSRKVYGSAGGAASIRLANPGVIEPMAAGTSLVIPSWSGGIRDRIPVRSSSGESEVAVLLRGTLFRYWEEINITRSVDTFDTVMLSAPLSVENPGFRRLVRPFSFDNFDIHIGGEHLFTGTLTGVSPDLSDRARRVDLSGYSLPGVLQDCTPPVDAYPVEFNDLNLEQIARTVAGYFGIGVEFQVDPGPVFSRAGMNEGKKVLPFLIGLSQQRRVVISSTPRGNLVFHRPDVATVPDATFVEGQRPLQSVATSFDPQSYYSHITGVPPQLIGIGAGPSFTARNPLVSSLRPFTFTAEDSEYSDIETIVNAKLGRMYANAVGYTITVTTWRTNSGKLFAPGMTVRVTAPGAMVYNPYDFLVRRVTLVRSSKGEGAQLDLVLPGSFSGEAPGRMPWAE